MSSDEYGVLMDTLHNQKKKIEKIDIHAGDKDERGDLTFIDGSTLTVMEPDCIDYLFQLKRGLDNDGDYVFRHIKDLNKYFDDEMFLAKNHKQKVADAFKGNPDNPFVFTYDVDKLQEEFLVSKRRNAKKFEPLRTDYFQIAAYRLHESAATLGLHQKYQQASKEYDHYFEGITKILATAFRNDKNFIKNFAKKNKKAKLNLLHSINKYLAATESAQDIQQLLGNGGVSSSMGIRLVLQTYSQRAEVCVELLNFVRIAHELNAGVETPIDNMKAQENKQLLVPELGSLLDCLDPHIRNSEAHLKTQIDKAEHKVHINDQDGYTAEYTYQEIIEMTNNLSNNLLPALLVSVVMEMQVMMVILSSQSVEYLTALLGIDNS